MCDPDDGVPVCAMTLCADGGEELYNLVGQALECQRRLARQL
jgi:hypothetical protein